MNAKTEKKKEILIRSFETLKDGCRNSKDTRDKVEECVGNMFKMDVDMATEMWIYLLEQYSDMLSSNEGWGLIGWIYWIAGDNIGEAAINNIVLKNAPIILPSSSKAENKHILPLCSFGKYSHCSQPLFSNVSMVKQCS